MEDAGIGRGQLRAPPAKADANCPRDVPVRYFDSAVSMVLLAPRHPADGRAVRNAPCQHLNNHVRVGAKLPYDRMQVRLPKHGDVSEETWPPLHVWFIPESNNNSCWASVFHSIMWRNTGLRQVHAQMLFQGVVHTVHSHPWRVDPRERCTDRVICEIVGQRLAIHMEATVWRSITQPIYDKSGVLQHPDQHVFKIRQVLDWAPPLVFGEGHRRWRHCPGPRSGWARWSTWSRYLSTESPRLHHRALVAAMLARSLECFRGPFTVLRMSQKLAKAFCMELVTSLDLARTPEAGPACSLKFTSYFTMTTLRVAHAAQEEDCDQCVSCSAQCPAQAHLALLSDPEKLRSVPWRAVRVPPVTQYLLQQSLWL